MVGSKSRRGATEETWTSWRAGLSLAVSRPAYTALMTTSSSSRAVESCR